MAGELRAVAEEWLAHHTVRATLADSLAALLAFVAADREGERAIVAAAMAWRDNQWMKTTVSTAPDDPRVGVARCTYQEIVDGLIAAVDALTDAQRAAARRG